MSAVPPNRNPVLWNQADADNAVRELLGAKQLLRDILNTRRRIADEATAEWQGSYRLEFDAFLQDAISRSNALEAAYDDAVNRIRIDSQRASDEQAYRDRAIQIYEEEQARKERERQQQNQP